MASRLPQLELARAEATHVPLAVVDLADSFSARAVGLLGRKQLGPDDGLYLAPCRSVHTIGMAFALDLVFVDRAHRVVRLVSALAPWRLAISPSAHGVIELAAGSIARHRIRVGDRLSLAPATKKTTLESLA